MPMLTACRVVLHTGRGRNVITHLLREVQEAVIPEKNLRVRESQFLWVFQQWRVWAGRFGMRCSACSEFRLPGRARFGFLRPGTSNLDFSI